MVKVATKTCSKCHACKPVNLFKKKHNQCKACYTAYHREHYQQNKEKLAARGREYRQQHKEEILAYQRKYNQQNKEKLAAKQRKYQQNNKEKIAANQREYYQTNKDKLTANQREYRQKNKEKVAAYKREYQQNNKEKIAAYNREYRQKNKEEIAAYFREYRQENKEKVAAYFRQRRRLDPEFNLLCRLRKRMYKAVKAAGLDKKCASSIELLGISPQGLKEWLEAQFTDGMTWENRSDWHVDHIIPCDAFDLTVDQNQRICFWYKNLQPLWDKDNLQKSNTYTETGKQALISAYCNQ